MCCNKKIAKIFLVVFNLIFFLFGLAVLAVGVVVQVDKGYLTKYLTNIPVGGETVSQALDSLSLLQNLSIALIVFGSVVLVIGFCGCCGALKEVKCLLLIYAVIVFLILAGEITIGALAYFYGDKVKSTVQGFMKDLITDYYTGATLGTDNALTLSTDTTGVSDAFDFAMAYFQCCGAYNYTDFGTYATNWPGEYNYTIGGVTTAVAAQVPITCCKMVDNSLFPGSLSSITFVNITDCLANADSYSTNQIGCYDQIQTWAMTYFYIICGVGIGVALLEVSLLVSACMLYKHAGDRVDDIKHPL